MEHQSVFPVFSVCYRSEINNSVTMKTCFRTVSPLVKKPHVSKGICGMFVKELLVLYKARPYA